VVREHVHRRKLTIWPWVIGVAVLLAALWAVSWILDPEGEITDPARLSTEGIETPDPAIVPAPANQ